VRMDAYSVACDGESDPFIQFSGESVRWKTSSKKWLKGRDVRLCLIALTDEATGRTLGRFTLDDSIRENLRTLFAYITRWGRPRRIRTDKSTLFAESGQIRRALAELDIQWTATYSPRDLGGAAPFFDEAHRNLYDELESVSARNVDDAATYLDNSFLTRWNGGLISQATPDLHAPPLSEHDLDSILTMVHFRTVSRHGIIRFNNNVYRLSGCPASANRYGQKVRIEEHADGEVVTRWNGSAVDLEAGADDFQPARRPFSETPRKPRFSNRAWMKGFFDKPVAPIWRQYK
jgi:hypothetical protein